MQYGSKEASTMVPYSLLVHHKKNETSRTDVTFFQRLIIIRRPIHGNFVYLPTNFSIKNQRFMQAHVP